jgi:L-ascorbate metabolism protein UlaG (beta-lactamase superfamily)
MNKVSIKYFLQAFFSLSDKNTTIFIDPYTKLGDLTPPVLKTSPDILLITHEHPDHNNREYSTEDTFEIHNPGEYDVKNVIVEGISTFHDKKNGEERGFNTIYSINFNGINFVHLGDLGVKLEKETIETLGVVDVLFIPVGGFFTIDYKEAIEITKDINPAIVVPMHYKTEKTSQLPLEGIDKFLSDFGGIQQEVESLDVVETDFDDEEFKTKVVVFKS